VEAAIVSAMTERRPNLVIDVGMHTGEDTAAFLAAGFDVVAVEANPDLVKDASQRFAAEVADGRLRIINAAIAEQRGTAQFGICSNSVWSSMDPDMIARNERAGLASYEYIEIDTIPFGDVMHQHGGPYYLKVDVEGYDMLCVRACASSVREQADVHLRRDTRICQPRPSRRRI
jgi:FkbM family methyltransferase